MSSAFGLSDRALREIRGALSRFPEVKKAVLYGSRAKGNYKNGSDIDLALFGDQLNHGLLSRIGTEMDDLLLPYKNEMSIFADLRHPDLIEHIESVAITFYEKQPARV
jgi:predicted nucleotidyltransferase